MAKTYQQIMTEARQQVPEVSPDEAKARLADGKKPVLLDVREREEFRQGYIPDAVSIPRGFLEMRVEETVPDKKAPRHHLLRRRDALAARRTHPEGARATRTSSRCAADSTPGRTRACRSPMDRQFTAEQQIRYSRHFLLPEVGEAGQAKLLDAKVLLHRRGRPRLAGGALPGGRRRGDARHRRHGRRRSLEPAAPDPAHQRPHRHAEGGVRPHDPAGAQPRRAHRRVPRAPDLRERVPHLRAVRHHRERLRQLPDALPGQRRLRAAEEAARRRRHLAVRGPGDGVQPAARAPATAACSRSRRRPARCRRARRRACSACCPASSAACRRSRRSS